MALFQQRMDNFARSTFLRAILAQAGVFSEEVSP